MSWGRRFAEVSGQNTVEGTKYGSQPLMEIFNKYHCLSRLSVRCVLP